MRIPERQNCEECLRARARPLQRPHPLPRCCLQEGASLGSHLLSPQRRCPDGADRSEELQG
eukprot:4925327-Pyramimonas_sp.AAC.1